jgi:hypothetical protein
MMNKAMPLHLRSWFVDVMEESAPHVPPTTRLEAHLTPGHGTRCVRNSRRQAIGRSQAADDESLSQPRIGSGISR